MTDPSAPYFTSCMKAIEKASSETIFANGVLFKKKHIKNIDHLPLAILYLLEMNNCEYSFIQHVN